VGNRHQSYTQPGGRLIQEISQAESSAADARTDARTGGTSYR
jgi:hypothetical protein